MKTAITTAWLFCLLSIVFYSCKKADSPTPSSNCNIVTLSESNQGQTANEYFEYNSSGKIIKDSNQNVTFYFSYFTGGWVDSEFSGVPDQPGSLQGTFVATTNSHGDMVSGVASNYDSLGNKEGSLDYAYTLNNQGDLLETLVTYQSTVVTDVQYTWQNGNPVQLITLGDTAILTYDPTKLSGNGDYLWINKEFPGVLGSIHSKNLLTSIEDQGQTIIFTYSFDATGKITQTSISGAESVSYDFTWQCQ